ncbi:MAG: gliding motility lipoprotein GldH [Bacteroidales bacterium]|nr:gliding motility lipoprotein GldH [Bacteroidales bacterium]
MKGLRKGVLWLLVLAVLSVLSSCGRNMLSDETTSVHNKWFMNDPAIFDVNVKDTIHGYDFYINIRHNESYRYSNLYVFLQTEFPNQHVTRDTLEFILAAPSGKWLGKGWGKIKQDHILLKKNLRFPLKGQYRFSIWQGMRADTLKGIEDVGLQIVRAQ